MSKRVEYNVRPVTRYMVTRRTADDESPYGTIETLAIFDNENMAHETVDALTHAARVGIRALGAARGRIDMALDGHGAPPMETVSAEIAAMACQFAAGKDLLFVDLKRHDGGWCLKFADDLGSAGVFELTFTDRQVGDIAGASGFNRAGLMTLLVERVENWLETCSPNGKLLQ